MTGEAPPSKETKAALSYGVHWSYGLAMGGLYGALRGGAGAPDAVGGLLFGTALWLLGDELLVPVLGLSEGPTAYPPEQHAHRLGAHLAYGLATAAAENSHRCHDTPCPYRKKTVGHRRRLHPRPEQRTHD